MEAGYFLPPIGGPQGRVLQPAGSQPIVLLSPGLFDFTSIDLHELAIRYHRWVRESVPRVPHRPAHKPGSPTAPTASTAPTALLPPAPLPSSIPTGVVLDVAWLDPVRVSSHLCVLNIYYIFILFVYVFTWV